MHRVLLLLFLMTTTILANQQIYTIAVCVTKSLENAFICKDNILKDMEEEVFIVKENNLYYTRMNIYTNKAEAQKKLKESSKYVLSQKAYIKELDVAIVQNMVKNKFFIDMDKIHSKQSDSPSNTQQK